MRSGAAAGFRAFATFGLLEATFALALPQLLSIRCGPSAESPWLALGLTLGYGVVGTLAGALVAAWSPADRAGGRVDRALFVLLLAALAAATLLQSSSGRTSQLALLGLLLIQLGLVAFGPASCADYRAFSAFGVLFLGVPFLTRQLLYELPGHVRWGAAFGFALLVAAVGAFVLRRPQRRSAVFYAPLVAAALLAGVVGYARHRGAHASASTGSNRNVILIVMDTVRADHLSLYGYRRATTPNLDALAGESLVFERAFAASDVSLTSHASLFTGLYGRQHGAHGPEDGRSTTAPAPLAERYETLAERLGQRGYGTSGVTANVSFLGRPFNLHQGFENYVVLGGGCCLTTPYEAWRKAPRRAGQLRTYVSADVVAQELLDLVARHRRAGRPYFVFANFMDAHTPHSPPAGYLDRFWDGQPDSERLAAYDGSLAYLDSQLGALFAVLRASGALEDTLLVVTADHGEALGERGLSGHDGVAVYQGLIRVPLIVRYPGGAGRLRTSTPVSTIDVLPTILEFAGVPQPAGPGVSLKAPRADRVVISESYPSIVSKERRHMQRAAINGSLKLVTDDTGRVELYDLDADSNEEKNLATPDDPRVARLRAELERWQRDPAAEAAAPADLDAETQERLRALGYVN